MDLPAAGRSRAGLITETGQVVSVSGDRAWVQTMRQSACQSCQARQGCGHKTLTALSGGLARQVSVRNSMNARPGDRVTLAIEPASLLRASLLVYALPLVLMVLAVAAAGAAGAGDGVAVLAAVLGLTAGLLLARRSGRTGGAAFHPVMISIEPALPATSPLSDPTVF